MGAGDLDSEIQARLNSVRDVSSLLPMQPSQINLPAAPAVDLDAEIQRRMSQVAPAPRDFSLGQFASDMGTAGGTFLDNILNTIPAGKQMLEDSWQTVKGMPSHVADSMRLGQRRPNEMFPKSPMEGASKLLSALVDGTHESYLDARTDEISPQNRQEIADKRRQLDFGLAGNAAATMIPGGIPARTAMSYVLGRGADGIARATDKTDDPLFSPGDDTPTKVLKVIGDEAANLAGAGITAGLHDKVRRLPVKLENRFAETAKYAEANTDPHVLVAKALTANRNEGEIRNAGPEADFSVEGKNIPFSEALRRYFPDINEFKTEGQYTPERSVFNNLKDHIKTRVKEVGKRLKDTYEQKLPPQTNITYGDILADSRKATGAKISGETKPIRRVYSDEILPVAEIALSGADLDDFNRIHLDLTRGEGGATAAGRQRLLAGRFGPRLLNAQADLARYDALVAQIESTPITTADLRDRIGGFGRMSKYNVNADAADQKAAAAYRDIDARARRLRDRFAKDNLSAEDYAQFKKDNAAYPVMLHAAELTDQQIKFESEGRNTGRPGTSAGIKERIFSPVKSRYPEAVDPTTILKQSRPYGDLRDESSPGLSGIGRVASLLRKATTPAVYATQPAINPLVVGMSAMDQARYRTEHDSPEKGLLQSIYRGGAGAAGWLGDKFVSNGWAEELPTAGAEALMQQSPIPPTSPTGNPNFKSLEAGNFDTPLDPQQQQGYEQWKATLPQRLQWTGDYDLQGFYKDNGPVPFSGDMHMPDTYKKPNHPTFSNESQYAPMGNPGSWNGNTFMPPAPPNFAEQPFRRDVSFVTQNRQAFIERVANLSGGNPQLLKDVSTVLTNPNQNQKETALAQLAVNLPELFVTARYPSEMNGKLYDPVDKDEFEKEITTQKTNGQVDPIFWAKQVSALNVDGRILQQEQPPMGPQSPFSSPPPRVETPVGSRRSYDY